MLGFKPLLSEKVKAVDPQVRSSVYILSWCQNMISPTAEFYLHFSVTSVQSDSVFL